LATPVAHIWFLKSLPSRIGSLLDMTLRQLEKVLYFESYIVTDPRDVEDPEIQANELLSEDKYRKFLEKYGYNSFQVGMGAEVIKDMLQKIDVEELYKRLRLEMKETNSEAKRKKIAKRLKAAESFKNSGNRPEWMIMDVIPVIPPDLRPLVPLDGGRFATSDLNDLYRRVINRNNRLKRLQELKAPEIIIRNEKRMLQEAVDALFDNGRRGKTITGANKRPLKSLSDMLKGKQGRFRQNLLGKRVDYSGRSVIVVGPELRLHQCGLPKKMALELFKPFIYNKLEEKGYVSTIKSAKKMVEKEKPEVWDILEEVTKEHPIMLNRAPTLHRLGIQAFEPILIEGKAIQLHPLVCQAFNADFDGDQMAVHVPLSIEAQIEARILMMSTNNVLSPAHGKPIIVPTQDIVLGIYYLTREKIFARGEHHLFANTDEVRIAYDANEIDLHARIKVRINGQKIDTTVGRVILSDVIPREIEFAQINRVMKKKELANLIDHCYRKCGQKKTVLLADRLRSLGYRYATEAGVSISIGDMKIPSKKGAYLEDAYKKVQEIQEQYSEGVITQGEKYNKIIDIWAGVSDSVAREMMKELGEEVLVDDKGNKVSMPSFNPIFMMADSGARGSDQQIRQLAGMRGLMAKPSGEIIETPITNNFREGLSVLQYFISTHGARKGLADTALKTANSGYLTRRLVDVAQDAIISEDDCFTVDGIEMMSLVENGEVIQPLGERILGRVTLEDIYDPHTGDILVYSNEEIDEDRVKKVEDAGIERITIRSVLTCRSRRGICVECYGRDLARGKRVNRGEAVGIIAAQSIGEPGTQLTMRTFHIGGAGLVAKEQSSLKSRGRGVIKLLNVTLAVNKNHETIIMNRHGELIILSEAGRERERYSLNYGAKLLVKEGSMVEAQTLLSEWDPFTRPILTGKTGMVQFKDIIENVTMREQHDQITGRSTHVIIESKDRVSRPTVMIKPADDASEEERAQHETGKTSYILPVGANLVVKNGEMVCAGDLIAKIPRETIKTKDITGGLPRVAELFEARKPKEAAIISEIAGTVYFGRETKGRTKIVVSPHTKAAGEPREYLIPKGKHYNVQEGDEVKAGEPLMDGSVNPHDILRVLGVKELAKFLVDEIQEVYRLQGVKINDKHIEVIVRQMLRRIKITDMGDTKFLIGDQVEKWAFEEENATVIKQGGTPAEGEPLLLGITKASLGTESFISASSFQETTKVLTEASIAGKIDYLRGLKENVIMGRLIPAGTGMPEYKDVKMILKEPESEEDVPPATKEAVTLP
jgi:DNA-directed RNA polymerase subunit beta'